MKRAIFFLLTLVFALGVAGSASCEKISVATLNWAPYISRNMRHQGYVARIITKAFADQGHEVQFRYWPWARSVAMAEQGRVDAYGPEYYAPKLEKKYHISKPFPGGPVGLFKLKGSNISYKKLEDLKGYRIGVVRGYVNEKKFDAADFLEKEPVRDDLTNIKKLLGDRLDLFFADKYVGKWLAEKNGYDPDKLVFIRPMVRHSLYLCFPKKREGSAGKAAAFNKGLLQIKKSGALDEILNNKGF